MFSIKIPTPKITKKKKHILEKLPSPPQKKKKITQRKKFSSKYFLQKNF